jgi:CHAT domain-containing protein
MLIACGSGRPRVCRGDEVQGLAPAFLYAGASSTVSTLWNVPDQAGAEFSRAFYNSCRERSGQNRCHPLVDLARSYRDAVLALSVNSSILGEKVRSEIQQSVKSTGVIPAYNWAAFVLHGWWQFQFPVQDRRVV